MSDRADAKAQAQQKALGGLVPKRSLLQRTCACGQHTILGSECEECRQKRGGILQHTAVNDVPSMVHDVLSSPGQPLDLELLDRFEQILHIHSPPDNQDMVDTTGSCPYNKLS